MKREMNKENKIPGYSSEGINKYKLCLLLISLLVIIFQIKAQTDAGCTNPPNCIINPGMTVSAGYPAYGNLETEVKCEGWYIAYGTPSVHGTNGIWLWSYNGVSQGEGTYTCYNFQKGHTYKVCLNIKTTNLPSHYGYLYGTFYIQATNGNFSRPTNAASQLIASWRMLDQVFTTYTFTFTANNTYSRLWLFPYMAEAPAQGVGGQYESTMNKVNVEEVSGIEPEINVTGETISIINTPITPGHWKWTPASLILSSNADSTEITTSVCTPTIFTATYVSECGICSTYILSKSVNGSQPAITISGNNTLCANQAVTLTASGADSYIWQPGKLNRLINNSDSTDRCYLHSNWHS